MDIRSIIDQLCKKDIKNLYPIDGIYKDLLSKKEHKDSFMVSFSSDARDYDDVKLGTINNKELLTLLEEIGEFKFIQHLNREIFIYIQSQVKKATDVGAWNNDNIWFEPNNRYVKWFQLNNIDPKVDKNELPPFLSKWAKDVIKLLKKNGEMKHQDILLSLDDLPDSYNHISKLFKTAKAKNYFKENIINNNTYYSLKRESQ